VSFTVVASFAAGPHAAAIPLLEGAGCTVRQIPAEARTWTPELIENYAPTADAWLGTFPGLKLPRHVLERSERARLVVSSIIGTDFIDVAAASELGILVAHGAMAENFDGMAEAGVMLISALRKALPGKVAALAEGRWKPVPAGHMVKGATIGIIGFGRIGQGVARRLQGWDCEVIAHDPYLGAEKAAAAGAELVSLEALLERSDVVVMLVTLTEETRHLIDAAAIARMKPGAHLINIGRGGCVDEAALLAALDEGRLAGAAIDTWETEPLPADHPLRRHPKVIATGHVVGHSEELYARIPEVAAENMLRGLRGLEPLHIRNPDALPAWHARMARLAA
jgi:D-3-phosphoglycerate dehydrogenase